MKNNCSTLLFEEIQMTKKLMKTTEKTFVVVNPISNKVYKIQNSKYEILRGRCYITERAFSLLQKAKKNPYQEVYIEIIDEMKCLREMYKSKIFTKPKSNKTWYFYSGCLAGVNTILHILRGENL